MATRDKLTTLEKAYIAGLFDGEGSISICKFRSHNSDYVCPHYILSVTCTNTNKEIIEWLYEKIGSSKQMRKREWGKSNWKTSYSWMASANKAVVVLKNIYPYLRIKKAQAKLAIEFQENKMIDRKFILSPRDKKKKGKTLSPETIAYREEVREKMIRLNGTKHNRKFA